VASLEEDFRAAPTSQRVQTPRWPPHQLLPTLRQWKNQKFPLQKILRQESAELACRPHRRTGGSIESVGAEANWAGGQYQAFGYRRRWRWFGMV